jgi:hypothetical protein
MGIKYVLPSPQTSNLYHSSNGKGLGLGAGTAQLRTQPQLPTTCNQGSTLGPSSGYQHLPLSSPLHHWGGGGNVILVVVGIAAAVTIVIAVQDQSKFCTNGDHPRRHPQHTAVAAPGSIVSPPPTMTRMVEKMVIVAVMLLVVTPRPDGVTFGTVLSACKRLLQWDAALNVTKAAAEYSVSLIGMALTLVLHSFSYFYLLMRRYTNWNC